MTTTDVITCKMVGKCCMTGEALEQPLTRDWKHTIDERIARDSEFKEALEQPNRFEGYETIEIGHKKIAQEPVAWIKEVELLYMKAHKADNIMNWKTNLGLKPEPDDAPLYTHPHQWQGLTDDEIGNAFHASISKEKYETGLSVGLFARAIDAILKEKNT